MATLLDVVKAWKSSLVFIVRLHFDGNNCGMSKDRGMIGWNAVQLESNENEPNKISKDL